jgi:hypothetical protein
MSTELKKSSSVREGFCAAAAAKDKVRNRAITGRQILLIMFESREGKKVYTP